MVHAQNTKTVPVIQPQAIVDNGYFVGSHQGTTPVNVDTQGFNYAVACVMLGETDVALAELSVYESDTTTDGDFAIIAASNFATSPATLPSATDDNKVYKVFIPLGGSRKRYLRVNAKGGNGSTGGFLSAWVDLHRANQAPNTATERGLGQQLFV